MPSTLRRIDDAPIAPDIVPADWADCVPAKPANDAISREKLFAEIRHAAETVAPKVDNTFRASDVNDIPALDSSSRAWLRRAGTVFVFALISVIAAAVWKHHGDTARQTVAEWVPLSLASSSPATEPSAEPAAQPAAQPQTVAAQPAAEAASSTATGFPPEAEQQIQSLTRDLAAMTQQVEQLKAQIETLKANQQAAVAPTAPPPVARAPAPKPQPKITALPPRPVPVAPPSSRPAYQPAMQAAATPPPPPAATASPPAYSPPPQTYPPPQATTQPNGEPIVRPPMPLPLSDRY
jgi:hypothetical protein